MTALYERELMSGTMHGTVILYHADCHDGFGAAYAAWKKFGQNASYIAVYHGDDPPKGLEGREVFIADFSYPIDTLLKLEQGAKRLVILDHHSGAEEAVRAVQEHVFDLKRSGAGIAWGYFHPEKPLPKLLEYVQDNDLWRFALPHVKEIGAFLSSTVKEFSTWDALAKDFEGESKLFEFTTRGKRMLDEHAQAVAKFAKKAVLVTLDGHKVLAIQAPRKYRSELGHVLSDKHPPFAIVWYEHHGMQYFSIRRNGSIDVAEIAKRHGGNGHHDASSFQLPLSAPLPFKKG